MGAYDFLNTALQDPNVIQAMGNVGQALSSGESVGAALNPAGLIRNIQTQKATGDLLAGILGGKVNPPVASTPGPSTNLTDNFGTIPALEGLKPTPKGQAGPDSITTTQTADGTVHTIKTPSAANLNTYGTSVPPEAVPARGTQLPFFRALLGM